MFRAQLFRSLSAFAIASFLLSACVAAADSEPPAAPEQSGDGDGAIIDGVPADDFPEGILVSQVTPSGTFRCSGVLVRPTLALTAGHCVAGGTSWLVVAPNAGFAASDALGAFTFDWTDHGDELVGFQHDVGVIVLNQPIVLPSFPVVPTAAMAFGTKVVTIGRKLDHIQNGDIHGTVSNDELFVSGEMELRSSNAAGDVFDYKALPGKTSKGDSGGPVLLASGGAPRVLVGVSSGFMFASEGYATLVARTDLETLPALGDLVGSTDASDAASIAQATDPCDGLTFIGECDGPTLSWCEDGEVHSLDCETACGFNEEQEFFDCL